MRRECIKRRESLQMYMKWENIKAGRSIQSHVRNHNHFDVLSSAADAIKDTTTSADAIKTHVEDVVRSRQKIKDIKKKPKRSLWKKMCCSAI